MADACSVAFIDEYPQIRLKPGGFIRCETTIDGFESKLAAFGLGLIGVARFSRCNCMRLDDCDSSSGVASLEPR